MSVLVRIQRGFTDAISGNFFILHRDQMPLAFQQRSRLVNRQKFEVRHAASNPSKYRNINLLSIDYAFRPRLRIRLTQGGRTYPWKPRAFGDQDSHLVFRYSCLHGHLYTVHLRFHIGFNPYTTLLYQYNKYTPRLRFQTSVPIIFGAESLDQ